MIQLFLQKYLFGLVQCNMGISIRKGNGGYIGVDTRTNVTSSVGSISMRKHRLERLGGNFEPDGGPLFEDDFATGDLTNWTVYNGSESSKWKVNTSTACLNSSGVAQTIPSGSTYAAFISNDNGVSNDYASSTDVHMYFTFTIPTGTTSLTLTFDWMCHGERASGVDQYDYGYINFINPSSFTPSAGSDYSSDTTSRERVRGTNISPNVDAGKFTGDGTSSRNNSASSGWVSENITLDSTEITQTGLFQTGVLRGLMFSWASDSSVVDNPGWTIANIRLTID